MLKKLLIKRLEDWKILVSLHTLYPNNNCCNKIVFWSVQSFDLAQFSAVILTRIADESALSSLFPTGTAAIHLGIQHSYNHVTRAWSTTLTNSWIWATCSKQSVMAHVSLYITSNISEHEGCVLSVLHA